MTDAASTMTPEGERTFDFSSEAALARVKKRYRAEARFRAYGLAAIMLAGIFVIALLGDIIRKGMPAFFEHRAMLVLDLNAEAVDPKGNRDPADLRAGDYQRVIASALAEMFPNVRDRRLRRKLEGLVSTGAADDLRAAVLRDPSLIGKRISFPVLLSDDADLYLKGLGTRIDVIAGHGPLVVAPAPGGTVEFTGTGAFAEALATIKLDVRHKAESAGRELLQLPSGDAPTLVARRAELQAKVTALKARVETPDGVELADPATLPSLLVEIGNGTVLLSEVGRDRSVGTILSPLSEPFGTVSSWRLVRYVTPEADRRTTDAEISWLEVLKRTGAIEKGFALRFFANGDSREPELAGIRGALIGSALTLLVTLIFCLPIGVGAAVYLEEFAPKNRLTDVLEVNINNLAAVPSIVFGLLGLAMFLNFFGLPRSAPLVGGLVLALLVLPTIIIASRAALKAVPPSIKEAALGVGASHQQAIFHHVLPLAMPGIMTGTIIGMAHALGETAPLLMIGMVAFIVDIPKGVTDAATVLPVQIYLWSDLPEVAFQAKTAAAIMVLLGFLFVMNGAAILLRRRFERRW